MPTTTTTTAGTRIAEGMRRLSASGAVCSLAPGETNVRLGCGDVGRLATFPVVLTTLLFDFAVCAKFPQYMDDFLLITCICVLMSLFSGSMERGRVGWLCVLSVESPNLYWVVPAETRSPVQSGVLLHTSTNQRYWISRSHIWIIVRCLPIGSSWGRSYQYWVVPFDIGTHVRFGILLHSSTSQRYWIRILHILIIVKCLPIVSSSSRSYCRWAVDGSDLRCLCAVAGPVRRAQGGAGTSTAMAWRSATPPPPLPMQCPRPPAGAFHGSPPPPPPAAGWQQQPYQQYSPQGAYGQPQQVAHQPQHQQQGYQQQQLQQQPQGVQWTGMDEDPAYSLKAFHRERSKRWDLEWELWELKESERKAAERVSLKKEITAELTGKTPAEPHGPGTQSSGPVATPEASSAADPRGSADRTGGSALSGQPSSSTAPAEAAGTGGVWLSMTCFRNLMKRDSLADDNAVPLPGSVAPPLAPPPAPTPAALAPTAMASPAAPPGPGVLAKLRAAAGGRLGRQESTGFVPAPVAMGYPLAATAATGLPPDVEAAHSMPLLAALRRTLASASRARSSRRRRSSSSRSRSRRGRRGRSTNRRSRRRPSSSRSRSAKGSRRRSRSGDRGKSRAPRSVSRSRRLSPRDAGSRKAMPAMAGLPLGPRRRSSAGLPTDVGACPPRAPPRAPRTPRALPVQGHVATALRGTTAGWSAAPGTPLLPRREGTPDTLNESPVCGGTPALPTGEVNIFGLLATGEGHRGALPADAASVEASGASVPTAAAPGFLPGPGVAAIPSAPAHAEPGRPGSSADPPGTGAVAGRRVSSKAPRRSLAIADLGTDEDITKLSPIARVILGHFRVNREVGPISSKLQMEAFCHDVAARASSADVRNLAASIGLSSAANIPKAQIIADIMMKTVLE